MNSRRLEAYVVRALSCMSTDEACKLLLDIVQKLREKQDTSTATLPVSAPVSVVPHGEKVRMGQDRARARGVHIGRPKNKTITPEILERAREMCASGMHLRDVSKKLCVPKTTLHRHASKWPATTTAEQRIEWGRKAGKASWDGVTPEEKARRLAPSIAALKSAQKLRTHEEFVESGRKGAAVAAKVVTHDQRIEWGRKGAAKRYATEPTPSPTPARDVITAMSNEELVVHAKTGAAWAKSQLVTKNSGFVAYVAKKYLPRCQSLHIEDLMVIGQMGLLRAVEKYNTEMGNKFLTYAVWWIRQAITHEIENNDLTIRIPSNKQADDLAIFKGKFSGTNKKKENVQRASRLRSLRSLDDPIGTDNGSLVLGDTFSGDAASADELIDVSRLPAAIQFAIGDMDLEEREVAILEHRLMGEATLLDVAKMFGCSRERIRQIEVELLKKLRPVMKDVAAAYGCVQPDGSPSSDG